MLFHRQQPDCGKHYNRQSQADNSDDDAVNYDSGRGVLSGFAVVFCAA